MGALTFSLSPEVAKVGRDLAATIPKHSRASMTEVFPSRDGDSWLAAEVARHLRAGLSDPSIAVQGSPIRSAASSGKKKNLGKVLGRPQPALFFTYDGLIARVGAVSA